MTGAGIGLGQCNVEDTNVYYELLRVKGHPTQGNGPRLAAYEILRNDPLLDSERGSDDVSRQAVLIISSDPLAAALLAAAVELAGHMPQFVQADERARLALMRVRPRLILVDCDHNEACGDEFVGPAIMTGASVVLFRSRRSTVDRSDLSERHGLRILDMPTEHASITSILREELDD